MVLLMTFDRCVIIFAKLIYWWFYGVVYISVNLGVLVSHGWCWMIKMEFCTLIFVVLSQLKKKKAPKC